MTSMDCVRAAAVQLISESLDVARAVEEVFPYYAGVNVVVMKNEQSLQACEQSQPLHAVPLLLGDHSPLMSLGGLPMACALPLSSHQVIPSFIVIEMLYSCCRFKRPALVCLLPFWPLSMSVQCLVTAGETVDASTYSTLKRR